MATEKKLVSLAMAKLATRTVLHQFNVAGDRETLVIHIAGGIMATAAPFDPNTMVRKCDHDLLLARCEQLEILNEELHEKVAALTRKA